VEEEDDDKYNQRKEVERVETRPPGQLGSKLVLSREGTCGCSTGGRIERLGMVNGRWRQRGGMIDQRADGQARVRRMAGEGRRRQAESSNVPRA